jgi:hypothetical protein
MNDEFDLEPRDYLYALALDFDIDAQLIAIRGLLTRNRKAARDLAEEIEQIEAHTQRLRGIPHDRAVDAWVDHLHHSVYQDAALSMAAVGMLAPVIETIFHQCFRRIGDCLDRPNTELRQHERWSASRSARWDCHLFMKGARTEKHLVKGIMQLADAIGIIKDLPKDLQQTISALFAYRNNMFHNGFEWPIEERDRFAQRIASERWPNEWFSTATSDDKPWIFYATDEFLEHCLKTIDDVIQGIGRFVCDHGLSTNASSQS